MIDGKMDVQQLRGVQGSEPNHTHISFKNIIVCKCLFKKKILIRLWLHDQVSCIMKGVLYSIVLLFEIWQLYVVCSLAKVNYYDATSSNMFPKSTRITVEFGINTQDLQALFPFSFQSVFDKIT